MRSATHSCATAASASLKMPPGRNEPCPCGSGRKYKHCCGKTAADAAAPKRRCRAMRRRIICLARRSRTRGLLERAAESFGRATALRPEFADAHNDLGEVLLRLGRTDAAIASCRRALALRPRFAAALGNLANAERARGALAAAIAGYRRVIALEPGLAEAHRNLGSALLEAGETRGGDRQPAKGDRAAPRVCRRRRRSSRVR